MNISKHRKVLCTFFVIFVALYCQYYATESLFRSMTRTTTRSSETTSSNRAEPTQDDDGDDNLAFAPVIIGAGQGTTGTHLYFASTCLLGYPSFHYKLGCVPNSTMIDTTSNNTTATQQGKRGTISIKNSFQKLVNSHLSTFPHQQFLNNDAVELKNRIFKGLEDVIIQAKEMDLTIALHDTPYPMTMPYLIELVKKHHNGKPPVLILSERDPKYYVKRRIQKHGSQLVCRNLTHIDPMTMKGGIYDVIGCIENGLRLSPKVGTTAPTASDFLNTITDMSVAVGEEAVVEQFRDYQDVMRSLSVFSMDIFATNGTFPEIGDFSRKLLKSIGPFYSKTNVSRIMDFWTMKYHRP